MLGPDLNKIDSFKATVLISTYKRPECLRLQILAWIGCSAVAQIRVNWFQSSRVRRLLGLQRYWATNLRCKYHRVR